jgi:hypothetical protein
LTPKSSKRISKVYLLSFKSEEGTKALAKLRKEIKKFSKRLQREEITTDDVKNAIKGLLADGLMNEGKRTTLKAFEENPTVLDEVANLYSRFRSYLGRIINNAIVSVLPTSMTLSFASCLIPSSDGAAEYHRKNVALVSLSRHYQFLIPLGRSCSLWHETKNQEKPKQDYWI